MLINKSFKIRIYPNQKQILELRQIFGAHRYVYNHFLQRKVDHYKKTGKSLTYMAISRELTTLKKEQLWLNETGSQILAQSVRNLDTAFNNFFKKKAGFPNFKSKNNPRQSFRVPEQTTYIKNNHIYIPKLGLIRFRQEIPNYNKLYSITITINGTGEYNASIAVDMMIPDFKIDKKKPVIGIDFGLKTFITTSDGQKIEHPKPYLDAEQRLKRLQRKLSRCKKGSNRRAKAKWLVAKQYQKVANRRNDFLHKLSRKMIDENQAIYLEDLCLKGMQERWGKQIQDLGWAEFTRQLSYKGLWYGCLVSKIDRFFPSSKTCSKCGYVHHELKLADRTWTCPKCGAVHDRDENASKNILEYGRADRSLRVGRPAAAGRRTA